MKKALKVLAFIVMLPLALGVPVFLTQTIQEDARVYAQTETLQDRVQRYKSQLGEEPSRAELERLKLRCSVSQTALKNLQTRVATAQESRTEAYNSINTKLNELISVLNEASIETADLKAQTDALKKKTDAFAGDLAAYKQAIDDASEVNCAEDPLALRAAIAEGRNRLTKLVSSVSDIRTTINNLVKPSLQKVKADLQTQAAATEEVPAQGVQDGAE